MDLGVGVIFLGLVMLPLSALSWIGITGLCLYILVTTHQPLTRQGAAILLAATVPMLWSRLVFDFFANPILNGDAALVSWISGTARRGNMVTFADNSGSLVILAPCSSLANVSLAILCWVTVSELVAHKKLATDIIWCVLACLCVVAINVCRMSIMGRSEAYYYTFHSGFANAITSWIITVVTVFVCLWGVRREIIRI